MNKSLLILSAACALGGCASIAHQFSPAAEPASGERARVRVISRYVAVSATPGSSCASRALPGAGMVLGRNLSASAYRGRSIGMPPLAATDKRDDAAEMYVAAGKPITFVQEEAFSSQVCAMGPVTFVPDVNKDYEVRYIYDYARGFCGATVQSLTDGKMLDHTTGSYCE